MQFWLLAQELSAARNAPATARPEGDPDDAEMDEEEVYKELDEEPVSGDEEDVEMLDDRELGPEDGEDFADEDEGPPW
jgi:hypothetical protein